MLLLQSATRLHRSRARIGLAIAGGGPIGGMYEMGVLRALDQAVDGLDLTALDVYVGVSSGAFLAASLANRIDTEQMCRIFITGDANDVRFDPDAFIRPAVREYFNRLASVPGLFWDGWRSLVSHPGEFRLGEVVGRLGTLIPTGLFDNKRIATFLHEAYTRHGRTDDFRELKRKLYIVAVDLDNGEAVRFGAEGWDDVPISKAVQASAALPALYPPVEIRGRQFVDGALRRTMHASAAFDAGIDLFIGINPLVPVDASNASHPRGKQTSRLASGGLPMVLSQTFRTLLQSRMQVGMQRHAQQYDDIDQLVFEPSPRDGDMFFTSAFSYGARADVCDFAHAATLTDLRERYDELAPLLARHGLTLRRDILDAPTASLSASLDAPPRRITEATERLRRALDDVDAMLKSRQIAQKA
ncbi:patatin-like phospholipase family protein [Xanthomonadaceae bacterium JHOS43]|nr:patatin-like phospholipase family protein [Xanthomonadaceae bacterium JHOS43]MCX7563843.1 patatin-like phospholipase family protein [Xanthomonadaceae bacterium XH05]